ncbi:hypothetical protein PAERUG_P18_London_17_VIM_2_04_10_01546 [Pseudomonas aeruginosa]|nr:hypothetical protein PAERUG_P18_London_17_VIM_2_04_10_01546 [Pseudomonas aeruginosa]
MCEGARVVEERVAAEHLVGRLARQCHRGVLADLAEQQVERGVQLAPAGQVAGLEHRLVLFQHLFRGDQHGTVRRTEEVRRQLRIGFVPAALPGRRDEAAAFAGEVHGEGRQAPRVAIQRGHRESTDGAGVEPAGKQAAQRDVGHQLLGHRLAEQLAGAFGAVLGALFVTFRAQRPVDQLAHTIAVEAQRLARPDLAQALVQAVAGSRRGGQGEQLGDAAGVEHRVGLGVGEDRLGFRGEQHTAGGRVVVQRLDPEAIAHQPQALLALVPQGEAVDAAEPDEGSLAPLQIGAQHHLGVRAGAEDLAQRLQLGAQLAEVVDLAAVGQRHPPTSLGKHRLSAVLQVDDRQAPMAEQRVPRQPQAFGVRPARGQGTGHAFEDAALLAEVAAPVGPAGDSTHG